MDAIRANTGDSGPWSVDLLRKNSLYSWKFDGSDDADLKNVTLVEVAMLLSFLFYFSQFSQDLGQHAALNPLHFFRIFFSSLMKRCQIWKETHLRPKRNMMPQHRTCQRGLKGLKTTLFLVPLVGFLLVYLSSLYLLTILVCLYNAAEHSQHIDTQTKLARRVRKIFSSALFSFNLLSDL